MRYSILFHGRVQGVGFRYTTERAVAGFAVSGWVRNEPDGVVRCIVEGAETELNGFVEAVQKAMARNITTTDISRGPATGEFAGFTIRYH